MTTVNQKFIATCESGDMQPPHPNARTTIASVAPGMIKSLVNKQAGEYASQANRNDLNQSFHLDGLTGTVCTMDGDGTSSLVHQIQALPGLDLQVN